MPRPTIDYMNARRAAKAASGGSSKFQYRDLNEYAPAEAIDQATNILAEFSRWAECSRQRYLAAWGVEETLDTDMVF